MRELAANLVAVGQAGTTSDVAVDTCSMFTDCVPAVL
jgi:hypothetical protein